LNLSDIQTLQLETTSHCNARCPHCPRFEWDTGLEREDLTLAHWDLDKVLPNIDVSKLSNLKKVIIEGDKGDPIMHPKVDKIIDHFVNAPSKPYVVLSTNGSIRNEAWWRELGNTFANNENFEVIFSIDGLEDTNHIYRVNVNYNKVIANAKAFIEAGGRALWKFIVFRHNEHQLDEAKQIANDLGFTGIWYVPNAVERFSSDQHEVYIKGKFSHILKPSSLKIDMNEGLHRFGAGTEYHNNIKSKRVEKVCPNLHHGHIYITYQQHVIPCCMMHNELYANYPGALEFQKLVADDNTIDISKNSLESILTTSPFFNNNLEEHLATGNLVSVCEKSCKTDILNVLKLEQSN
jgi:MoaA/NifB/PqqE/SkfB family radical SAM enzyme